MKLYRRVTMSETFRWRGTGSPAAELVRKAYPSREETCAICRTRDVLTAAPPYTGHIFVSHDRYQRLYDESGPQEACAEAASGVPRPHARERSINERRKF